MNDVNEGKLITGVVVTLSIAFISIPWSVAWHKVATTKAAFEAGYEQQTLPGNQYVYWVKKDGTVAEEQR